MIVAKGKLKAFKPMKSVDKVIFHIKKDSVPELDKLQYMNDSGYLAFHVDEFKESVIKAIENKRPGVIDDRRQTHSQRYRGLVFQIFAEKYPEHEVQNNPESKKKWGEAYNAWMENELARLRNILEEMRSKPKPQSKQPGPFDKAPF